MAEPGIILNSENNDRSYETYRNLSTATDRALRRAVRFYQADNKENQRKADNLQSLIDYHRSEGYDTGWDELSLGSFTGRIRGNNLRLRALNGELKKRKNNRRYERA